MAPGKEEQPMKKAEISMVLELMSSEKSVIFNVPKDKFGRPLTGPVTTRYL